MGTNKKIRRENIKSNNELDFHEFNEIQSFNLMVKTISNPIKFAAMYRSSIRPDIPSNISSIAYDAVESMKNRGIINFAYNTVNVSDVDYDSHKFELTVSFNETAGLWSSEMSTVLAYALSKYKNLSVTILKPQYHSYADSIKVRLLVEFISTDSTQTIMSAFNDLIEKSNKKDQDFIDSIEHQIRQLKDTVKNLEKELSQLVKAKETD